jgi:hypothetical protein
MPGPSISLLPPNPVAAATARHATASRLAGPGKSHRCRNRGEPGWSRFFGFSLGDLGGVAPASSASWNQSGSTVTRAARRDDSLAGDGRLG